MVSEMKRRTTKVVELQSFSPRSADRTLAAADVAWIARIVWASQ
jgi:phage repressor protein C with HTH and peptisase S24 domain